MESVCKRRFQSFKVSKVSKSRATATALSFDYGLKSSAQDDTRKAVSSFQFRISKARSTALSFDSTQDDKLGFGNVTELSCLRHSGRFATVPSTYVLG